MSSPFLGEIRIFTYVFAPRGWADCNGQLLTIQQNTALFSLLGTFYGGDGRTTFALPNLQARVALGTGQGNGLSPYDLGQVGGVPTVTLASADLPQHTHGIPAHNIDPATTKTPDPTKFLATADGGSPYSTTGTVAPMSPSAVPIVGGSAAHNNLMPYLTLRYCIALEGVFPKRP